MFRIALFALAGVLAVCGAAASLLVEHSTPITLPAPTGAFAVGRVIYDWTDSSAPDAFAPNPGVQRELLVWVWYPAADRPPDTTTSDYMPPLLRAEIERARPALITGLLTRNLSRVRTNSVDDADVSPKQQTYPIVIMRAGASAEVVHYSALAEDLASHGYVVVGFDAPYRTGRVVFPDGRVIRESPQNNPELCLGRAGAARNACANRVLSGWTSDIGFVLDRLTASNARNGLGKLSGHLDTAHVGVFGHSFGGAAALQFCSEDRRCTAGVDVDGAPQGSVIETGLQRPFMFLLSDHTRETDAESRHIQVDIQSIYDRLPENARFRLTIRGAHHFTFSDDGALLKSSVMRGVLRATGRLHIEGRRQLAVTAYSLRAFFDTFLKGAPPPASPSPAYPELVAEP